MNSRSITRAARGVSRVDVLVGACACAVLVTAATTCMAAQTPVTNRGEEQLAHRQGDEFDGRQGLILLA